MPYLISSTYNPPRFLANPHIQTIYANRLRRVGYKRFRRERIDTPDGDFIDLDWSEISSGPIAILVHGLEGNSSQTYMCGMAQALNRRGLNTVSINLRGCGGEANRQVVSYDLGKTQDLDFVSQYVAHLYPRRQQFLVGFSLGGNLVLKYLGEKGKFLRPQIARGVAFSVPCDLKSAASVVHASSNRLYYYRFMLSIYMKLRQKNQMFPGQIPNEAFRFHRSFKEFDDYYTVPLHGYSSTEDYWEESSCKNYLSGIAVPALLINAKDDPIIGSESFPVVQASSSNSFYLETPRNGGHVGFVSFNQDREYWSEKRAAEFLLDSERRF